MPEVQRLPGEERATLSALGIRRNRSASPLFLALQIIYREKYKLDGCASGLGVPYSFYVGIKTEFLDFIEQSRTFDSLGEDLGSRATKGGETAYFCA
jgi:hypothetical protein